MTEEINCPECDSKEYFGAFQHCQIVYYCMDCKHIRHEPHLKVIFIEEGMKPDSIYNALKMHLPEDNFMRLVERFIRNHCTNAWSGKGFLSDLYHLGEDDGK